MFHEGLLTLHLIGLVVGLGAVTVGDLAVLRPMLRRRPWPTADLRDLSIVIWSGLALLTGSGSALFAENPTVYLHNSGFQAKMVLVAVLIANGALLHRRLGSFTVNRKTLLAGSVSSVSWYGALIVAMYKAQVHLSLLQYLGLYVAAAVVVWLLYGCLHTIVTRRPTDTGGFDPAVLDHIETTVSKVRS